MGATQSAHNLTLDTNIRDWVVLPMFVIMVFVNLLRHYVQQLLLSSKAADAAELKHKQMLMRCGMLRKNGGFLTPAAWAARKGYMANKEGGRLYEKVPKGKSPMAAMNPMAMLDMMKGNITFIVPNMAMMAIINQFFQGFVLVKVPFSLTHRFKTMLHRGVDLSTLDVSYVSSLSWYFLLMFGLRGLIKLLLGEDSAALDESRQMQAQMGMGMGGQAGFNADAAFKGEREQLEMAKHKFLLEGVEKRLLGRKYPHARGDEEDEYTAAAALAATAAAAAGPSAASPKAKAAGGSASGAPRQKVRK